MTIRLIFLLFSISCYSSAIGQEKKKDTLSKRSYEFLYDQIYKFSGTVKATPYLKAYLTKAKREANDKEIINGYNNYLYEVPEHKMLNYADSMIYTSEKTDRNELIGSAYLTKGIVYYSRKEHNKALDNYLKANRYISTTKNEYIKHKAQYNIAHIKYYLGFYYESVSLFRKCADYFKTENTRAYLNCLHSLSLCYNKLGHFQESTEMNNLATAESKRLQDNSMLTYISHSEGINDYFRRDYISSIEKLKGTIPYLQKQQDFGNLSVANFYIALAYWDLGKREESLPYLLKVDRIFADKKYIRPDLRRNYELLIDYYKNKQDKSNELFYVMRLLEADKILHTNYKYLAGRILKEYDTAELLKAKNDIENDLRKEKYYSTTFLLIVMVLVPVLGYFIYRNIRLRQFKKNYQLYKEKYEPAIANNNDKKRPNISQDLEKDLLVRLQRFEDINGFTRKDMTVDKLAETFGTNNKYLSQLINFHKGKSYPDYINNLRIQYITQKLEKDKTIRKYTYTAIANEAGFGTAQQFTVVFKRIMGMPFSFFLEQLRKND